MRPGTMMWVQVLSDQMATVRVFYDRRKYGIIKRKKEDIVVRDQEFVRLMIGLSKQCPRFEDLRQKRMLRIPVQFRTGEFPAVVIDETADFGLLKSIVVHQIMTR